MSVRNFMEVGPFCKLQPPLNLHIILKGNTVTFKNSITQNFKAAFPLFTSNDIHCQLLVVIM